MNRRRQRADLPAAKPSQVFGFRIRGGRRMATRLLIKILGNQQALLRLRFPAKGCGGERDDFAKAAPSRRSAAEYASQSSARPLLQEEPYLRSPRRLENGAGAQEQEPRRARCFGRRL